MADALSENALRALAAILSLMLALLVSTLNVDAVFERGLGNMRDALGSRPASGEIHIVEVDAKSLGILDSWPWKRSKHAELVDALSAAGAEQIVFDIDFSSHADAIDDRAFADAIARAGGKVVLPTFRQRASHGDGQIDRENLPIPALRNHAMLGSVNVEPDRAGQVNRYPYGVITGQAARPSIAALLADHPGEVGGDFAIDQSIEIESIPRHSFVDIIEGRFDRRTIKGKRIIVGATAIELGDRYATARFGIIPGVVIQAAAAETLMAGRIAPEMGPWPLLLLALAGLFVGVRHVRQSDAMQAAAAAANIIVCFSIGALLHHHRIVSLETAPALLLIALASFAFFFIRIVRNAAMQRLTDRETGLPNMSALRRLRDIDGSASVVVAEMQNLDAIRLSSDPADARQFLRAIADRLRLASGGGQLYRIDSGRFCWAMPSDNMHDADAALEGAAALFNAPFEIGQRSVRAVMCFGIAKEKGSRPIDLVNKAMLAASRATEFGLRYMWYGEGLAEDTDLSLFVVSEFDAALQAGQISVVYQPKYCVKSQMVTAAEALVRWHHPQKGAISPAVFVPILEQEKLLEPLTLFTLDRALKDMAQWRGAAGPMRCAINISASLLADEEFTRKSLAILAANPVDPQRITFELTESAVLSSLAQSVAILDQCRQSGIQLSIDDYGTGQSTLSYLKSFAADEIKIDQSFIVSVATNPTNRIMVQSTIEMAHAMGMKVVAEGVEDEQTFDVLCDLRCDMLQGWRIGKPVPAEEFFRLWCLTDQRAVVAR